MSVATVEAPHWLKTREVARLLGRPTRTVLTLAKQGYLPVSRIGGAVPLFPREAIEAIARKAGAIPANSTAGTDAA